MIYVINDNDDPFFNHAAEEYLMNNFDEEVFMLWRNRQSILIGKNQNIVSEINQEYIKENNMIVVRRLSGGGAVYNDLGNINFTFITSRDYIGAKIKNGFEKFASPVVNALKSLGVDAVFTGRNDIVVDGKKISGNAQYFGKHRVLHHGTLLYDCDMSKLSSALRSRTIKFVDKSVKSISSRVTNISYHMKEKMSLFEFKDYLQEYIMKTYGIDNVYEFNEKDIVAINDIAKSRFATWEWNYGRNPDYKYKNSVKYPCGVIEYYLKVENGEIEDISIYGDFFGEKNIRDLEKVLVGLKCDKKVIEPVLNKIDIDDYIHGITVDEFISGLMDIK